MRKQILLAMLFVALVAVVVVRRLPMLNPPPGAMPPVEVYFSPHGGCTDAVVRAIRAARHSILVQAYSFTSTPIAQALIDAHQRGVEVKVIFDKENATEQYSLAAMLRDAGVSLSMDALHAHAHNKVMILDDAVVITGSFNFTQQAEHSNAENLLVIRDRTLAARYVENWREHARHSVAVSPPGPRP
jgi:phosphatidylserine/phosphatidylglycerophosphate/cardiolipin synthase-like enzyme